MDALAEFVIARIDERMALGRYGYGEGDGLRTRAAAASKEMNPGARDQALQWLRVQAAQHANHRDYNQDWA